MAQVLGKTVGPIGYGLMGFTWRPEPSPIADAVETMKAAFNQGATLWNGAEFYGTPELNSMTILKAYFTKYPEDADKILLSMKGGSDVTTLRPEGSPEAIRRSVNNIISQLGGVKKLDVFVIARRDHSTSFKDTLETLQKEFVDTGKIGGIGVSECSAETVHEASKYTNVALAEVELNLFSPDILKNGVAEACAQNNIPIIAYSPMSRGILTGNIKTVEDVKHLGRLAGFPRFQALEHNLKLVQVVQDIAAKKGSSAAQIAIAWVRSVGKRPGAPTIIPLPGATTVPRVKENYANIELTKEEVKALDELADTFEVEGGRYPDGAPTEL